MPDLQTIPYPDRFTVRIYNNQHGWWCTLQGRPKNDAPYWHGHGDTEGDAFQKAIEASRQGFEGEGVRVNPIGGSDA